MTAIQTTTQPARTSDRQAELETVLAAWHDATVRLEKTHNTLRAEVRRLTDELEVKNRELARKNRLADLGQMASHIAHEVRNTLVPVTLYLSLLKRRVASDETARGNIDKIDAGLLALDATVNDLLQFTSQNEPQIVSFCAAALVREVIAALAPQLDAQGIDAVTESKTQMVVKADRHMLRRTLLNLTLNAVDAMPDGGRLTIHLSRGPGDIQIRVADQGPGLSEDALQRVFEPYYTTKPGGTGLGLALVHRFAEVHSGWVTAGNGHHGGAVFTLAIPQANDAGRKRP